MLIFPKLLHTAYVTATAILAFLARLSHVLPRKSLFKRDWSLLIHVIEISEKSRQMFLFTIHTLHQRQDRVKVAVYCRA